MKRGGGLGGQPCRLGSNTFDLAEIYGDGQCEVLLGKVLKRGSSGPDVDPVQVWVRRQLYLFDFSKDYILGSVDGILERLQIERLDSLLLHRPDASWSLKRWRKL